MSIRQNGFTIIETLLTALILAVVGFGGYYVWQNEHKTKTTSLGPATSASTAQKSIGKTADPYAGWKTATLKYERISYKYPSDWTLTDNSVDMPKSAGGCTYPGADKIILLSPSNEEVAINTGVYCIGDAGSAALASSPITSLGQSMYLVFQNYLFQDNPSPKTPLFACLANTTSPNTYLALDSKNIFTNANGGSATPANSFCYYPYDPSSIQNGNFPSETLQSIENSPDFSTAKLIFESMSY